MESSLTLTTKVVGEAISLLSLIEPSPARAWVEYVLEPKSAAQAWLMPTGNKTSFKLPEPNM